MTRKKVDLKDKNKFLQFVYLSDEEYADLCTMLSKEATDEWIEELNGALGSKGDPYVSHYWTIRNWARKKAKKTTTVTSNPALVAWFGVLELLKQPDAYMPTSPEPLRLALHAMLTSWKITWPQLRARLQADPALETKIRERFLQAYK